MTLQNDQVQYGFNNSTAAQLDDVPKLIKRSQ